MALITRLRAFVNHDEGQDLLEYALLVALIALVAVDGLSHSCWINQKGLRTFSCRLRGPASWLRMLLGRGLWLFINWEPFFAHVDEMVPCRSCAHA